MSLPNDKPLQKLQFYVTPGYCCGYLPNKVAMSLIATPEYLINAEIYSHLIQQGFRRSGNFVYRPHCENCQACVPVRVITQPFIPNRSQKRAYKQHQGLTATILPVAFHAEHYALYVSYQQARHTDHTKPDTLNNQENSAEQYQTFLCQTNVDSVLIEFRNDHQLKMVSVIDIVHDGISAVYTFYDTSDAKASYGTYNVLWQIQWAKHLGLPYLYLGYWIKDSPKMVYKQNYQPLEKLIAGEWLKSSL